MSILRRRRRARSAPASPARAARRRPPPSRSRGARRAGARETAIATAAPAAATTSVASETHTQSPGYQPIRAIHRRRIDASRPETTGSASPHSQAVAAGRPRARRRSAGSVPSVAAIANLRSRDADVVTASAPARSPSARRPSSPSDRPQFGQKLDLRRIGAPHSQRATRCEPCRSSSISPSRASMPTTIAARSCRRSSRNPPRRYISTSSPPRSRSVSSRALSSVRRSRRSTPACARRGATPADPLARRRNNDTRLECRCPLGGLGGLLELDDDEALFGHLAHGPGGAFARVARSPSRRRTASGRRGTSAPR